MTRVQPDPISIDAAVSCVRRADCGALVLFLGTVRDHSHGRQIIRLDYEVYGPMAESELARVEAEVRERYPVREVVIVHRTGVMEVGEVAVAIAVSSAHRREAFAACQYAIDRIKQVVPIWKTEVTKDGTFIVEGEEAQEAPGAGAGGDAGGSDPSRQPSR